jgi:hypothetical protein
MKATRVRAVARAKQTTKRFCLSRYDDDVDNKPATTAHHPHHHHARRASSPPALPFPSNSVPALQFLMASTKLTDRTEPHVVPRAHTTAVRSRLPWYLRVPILVVLNSGIKTLLWSFALNFLAPELGIISRIPQETDLWSVYSPAARLGMHAAIIGMNWYFQYDCEFFFSRRVCCWVGADSGVQSTMSRR